MAEIRENRIITLGETIRPDTINPIIEKLEGWNYKDDEEMFKLKEASREPIRILIGTYGGECYAGLGLIGAIKNSRTPIYTICYGEAFSMGLPILASGHKRFIGRYGSVLYHEIRGGGYGQNEMLKLTIEEYDRIQLIIDEIIVEKTKLKQKRLNEVKKSLTDWYIPAEEALRLGIVDGIL